KTCVCVSAQSLSKTAVYVVSPFEVHVADFVISAVTDACALSTWVLSSSQTLSAVQVFLSSDHVYVTSPQLCSWDFSFTYVSMRRSATLYSPFDTGMLYRTCIMIESTEALEGILPSVISFFSA